MPAGEVIHSITAIDESLMLYDILTVVLLEKLGWFYYRDQTGFSIQ